VHGTAREITGRRVQRERTIHSLKVGIYNNTAREKNNGKGTTKYNPRQT
jgi:hypothetical protein